MNFMKSLFFQREEGMVGKGNTLIEEGRGIGDLWTGKGITFEM